MTESCTIYSPVGNITVLSNGSAVTAIDVGSCEPFCEPRSALLVSAARQLCEYFAGERKRFELPLEMHGTDFQMQVWGALLKIPYGATASYGDVAAMISNPRAARAVGNANNRNRIAIIVPCHRVINADGSLGGYGGGEDIRSFCSTSRRNTDSAGKRAQKRAFASHAGPNR